MKNINPIKKYGSGIRTDIYIFQDSYNKIYPLNFKYLRFISFDFNIRYQLRSKKLSFLNNPTLHSVTQRKKSAERDLNSYAAHIWAVTQY